jgi:prevent-host-death family protein
MEITTKQLRLQPGKIISRINIGQEIIVTYRGKPRAKIIPIDTPKPNLDDSDNELFGIWKEKNDTGNVDQYIRNIRKGRKLC